MKTKKRRAETPRIRYYRHLFALQGMALAIKSNVDGLLGHIQREIEREKPRGAKAQPAKKGGGHG